MPNSWLFNFKQRSAYRGLFSAGFLVLISVCPTLGSEAPEPRASNPIWHVPGTIHRETVLFVRGKDGTAQTQLMFIPSNILSVRSADRRTDLKPGEMKIAPGSRMVSVQPNSSIISLRTEELQPVADTPRSYRYHSDGAHRLYFSEGSHFHQLQYEVDYETNDTWNGPVPTDQRRLLPKFSAKRARHNLLTVVLLGDSISEGYNASGFTGVPPFQASYGEIFVSCLRQTGSVVNFTNLSKAGTKAHWGFEQVSKAISARPDLLVLAFGMNDATSEVPVTDFTNDLTKILRAVRKELPDCEFVIIAGMSPNPDWDRANKELRSLYHDAIIQLSGNGIAVCDVKSVWDFVAKRKGFWSITGNGVNHPNDFGHRLYAECLSATVLGWR